MIEILVLMVIVFFISLGVIGIVQFIRLIYDLIRMSYRKIKYRKEYRKFSSNASNL